MTKQKCLRKRRQSVNAVQKIYLPIPAQAAFHLSNIHQCISSSGRVYGLAKGMPASPFESQIWERPYVWLLHDGHGHWVWKREKKAVAWVDISWSQKNHFSAVRAEASTSVRVRRGSQQSCLLDAVCWSLRTSAKMDLGSKQLSNENDLEGPMLRLRTCLLLSNLIRY